MSTYGAFSLMTNTGKADNLLLATDILSYRITKYGGNVASWLEALDLIKETHVLFVDGAYKPFVAAGFQYDKILTTGGGNVQMGSSVRFPLQFFGDFINDAVVHIKLSKLRTVSPLDKIRYVAFPGHKILTTTLFTTKGPELDKYTSDHYNAYYNYHVAPNKKTGWLRNVGQEIPHQAYLTADPEFDSHREYKSFGDGYQTFKQSHNELELWIPLLFWFTKLNNSLPSTAINVGETAITCQLAEFSDLISVADYGGGGGYIEPTVDKCELYLNNIFINEDVYNLFIKHVGFTLIRVHVTHRVVLTQGNNNILMSELKWPVETLYVAFKPQSNLALSQNWHTSASLELKSVKTPVAIRDKTTNILGTVTSATASTAVLQSSGVNPLSAAINFYNGFMFIITGGTGFSATNDELNRHTVTSYNNTTKTISVAAWNTVKPDSTTTYEMYECVVAVNFAQYYKEVPSIDTIKITAEDIPVYHETAESFYNSYLPYRFGKTSNTPSDRGWYMVNFNFLPGDHQPSGHINISRARAFYIAYTSKFINNTNQVELLVLADAINFLLIDPIDANDTHVYNGTYTGLYYHT